jgi:hypothetical protein
VNRLISSSFLAIFLVLNASSIHASEGWFAKGKRLANDGINYLLTAPGLYGAATLVAGTAAYLALRGRAPQAVGPAAGVAAHAGLHALGNNQGAPAPFNHGRANPDFAALGDEERVQLAIRRSLAEQQHQAPAGDDAVRQAIARSKADTHVERGNALGMGDGDYRFLLSMLLPVQRLETEHERIHFLKRIHFELFENVVAFADHEAVAALAIVAPLLDIDQVIAQFDALTLEVIGQVDKETEPAPHPNYDAVVDAYRKLIRNFVHGDSVVAALLTINSNPLHRIDRSVLDLIRKYYWMQNHLSREEITLAERFIKNLFGDTIRPRPSAPPADEQDPPPQPSPEELRRVRLQKLGVNNNNNVN